MEGREEAGRHRLAPGTIRVERHEKGWALLAGRATIVYVRGGEVVAAGKARPCLLVLLRGRARLLHPEQGELAPLRPLRLAGRRPAILKAEEPLLLALWELA